uniref:Uncharacterized protein TCIL3000_7_3170 n=1 Tax=Trypanosoma congolense (strain IL3000) TaxID=1068625 RepID=G0UQ42_TRYCI|nr:unnamed protein product [Trypanosoma congolense IL3000]
MTLVNDNIRLQKELESILATDVVAELKKTREELQVLREKVLNQPTTGFACASQASRPAPEAVLSTTQELIQQQQYGQGLEYVLMANQPQLVLHLFAVLSQSQESAYSKLIEDVATPNSIWCRVVTQLIAAPTTSEEKDMAVGILIDILSEREQLLQKTGPSARVADSLRTFVRDAKAEGPCSSSMRSLKNLEKLLP